MLQFTFVIEWFFRVETNLQVSCGLFVLPLVVQLWNTWIVVILLNVLFLSDVCACQKIGPGFQSAYVVVILCLFCDLRAEVAVHFIDICVIVGHISLFKYIQNISFNIAFIYSLITFKKTQCFSCSGMSFGILLLIGQSCLITYREYSVTMCSLRHTLLAHLIIISSWKREDILTVDHDM